jgi:hypothetical protein
MQSENFPKKNFLGPKIRFLDRYKYPEKTFFDFTSIWRLCTGTKDEKVVLFGFSTGTKGQFRIFEQKLLPFSTFSTGFKSERYRKVRKFPKVSWRLSTPGFLKTAYENAFFTRLKTPTR